jgi:hypothetical protein
LEKKCRTTLARQGTWYNALMIRVADGVVVMICAAAAGIYLGQGKYLIAVIAGIVGVLAWNDLKKYSDL